MNLLWSPLSGPTQGQLDLTFRRASLDMDMVMVVSGLRIEIRED
jgi:hypothetical protein